MANQIAATTDTVANAVQEIATGAVQQAEEIQEAAEYNFFKFNYQDVVEN